MTEQFGRNSNAVVMIIAPIITLIKLQEQSTISSLHTSDIRVLNESISRLYISVQIPPFCVKLFGNAHLLLRHCASLYRTKLLYQRRHSLRLAEYNYRRIIDKCSRIFQAARRNCNDQTNVRYLIAPFIMFIERQLIECKVQAEPTSRCWEQVISLVSLFCRIADNASD